MPALLAFVLMMAAQEGATITGSFPPGVTLQCRIERYSGGIIDPGTTCTTSGWCSDPFARVVCEKVTTSLAAEEQLDVPAIKTKACRLTQKQIDEGYCCTTGAPQTSCPHDIEGRWTCRDRERILEFSESGKAWCRKVQDR